MNPTPAELDRLERRHKDIVQHGAKAQELQHAKELLQERRRSYVQEHGLACFKCGTTLNDWAKCGKTKGRYWAICVVCVREKRI